MIYFFFFQAEDGIRDVAVTGVQTCALPISSSAPGRTCRTACRWSGWRPTTRSRPTSSAAKGPVSPTSMDTATSTSRSEEHTSELQSRLHLVCRLLLEKKKNNAYDIAWQATH